MKFLLLLLGVMLVFEGVPWFLSPNGMRRVLLHLAQGSEIGLRLTGFCFMAAGLLLVYIAVNHL